MLFKMKNIPTEPTSAKAPAINHTFFLFSQIEPVVSETSGWQVERVNINTPPDCTAWQTHRRCNSNVREMYHVLWSAVFEMKSED